MASLNAGGRIGDISWLIASGERREVFRALGEHVRPEIADLLTGLESLKEIREHAIRDRAEQFGRVLEASRLTFPTAWSELAALAEGAAVAVDELALLTLRGDLRPAAIAGGCSDFGWTDGRRAILGHNEDGGEAFDGLCSLLTLQIDDEPSILTWWLPGFLPGNTYTINDHGLIFGVDAIHPRSVKALPGRAFVARSLQRCATFDEAISLVRAHPVAGAFAYAMGRLDDISLVSIEQAGDEMACHKVGAGRACMWHTNHLRLLPRSLNVPTASSLGRGEVLEHANVPAGGATTEWLLDILAGAPFPDGVRAEGRTVTLCTFVADLSVGTLTALRRGGTPVTAVISDLLEGRQSSTAATPSAPAASTTS